MRVHVVWLSQDIDIEAPMKCPKNIEYSLAWLNAARKAVKTKVEIPLADFGLGWQVTQYSANQDKVFFELKCDNDYIHIFIDRRANALST